MRRVCKKCGKEFLAKRNWVLRGSAKYCSTTCQHEGRKTGRTIKCFLCGKEAYKSGKDLKKSKSKKYFCTKKCSLIWHNVDRFGAKHQNWKFGSFAYKPLLKRSGQKEMCLLCSTKDTRVLAVHHIDKNRRNNILKNLAWLCHNCHFLVHHFSDHKQKFEKKILIHANS